MDLERARFRPWLVGVLVGIGVLGVLWVSSDGPSPDTDPRAVAKPEPGLEASPGVPESDLSGSAKSPNSPTASDGPTSRAIPYVVLPKPGRRGRERVNPRPRTEEDRAKALSRLEELGYQPWEAEELRALWDEQMDKVDRELDRLGREDPDRSLYMDRLFLTQDAFDTLRGELDERDYVAARYAAGVNTRVEVYRVTSNSLAHELGILPGDHVYSYDGETLFGVNQLNALIDAETESSRPVVIGLRRDGNEFFVEVPGGNLQSTLLGVVSPP